MSKEQKQKSKKEVETLKLDDTEKQRQNDEKKQIRVKEIQILQHTNVKRTEQYKKQ